jgi:hypothetical protein
MNKTLLRMLIEQHVTRGAATTFATESERLGEAMAREIFKDRAFREEMVKMARAAFSRTMDDLRKPARPRRTKRRR